MRETNHAHHYYLGEEADIESTSSETGGISDSLGTAIGGKLFRKDQVTVTGDKEGQLVSLASATAEHPDQRLLEAKIKETLDLFEQKGWLEEGSLVPLIGKEALEELLRRKIISEKDAEDKQVSPEAAVFTRLYMSQDTKKLVAGELGDAAMVSIGSMIAQHRETKAKAS